MPVIRIESLSKRYRLGVIGRTALHEDLARWWARLHGRPDPTLRMDQLQRLEARKTAAAALTDDAEHVWALRDVSFDVKQGEVLGIIGRNGAGKSTLLKILSRVTAPTLGCVKVKGRIASLLEVGTGFNPELTGRENIFLNGAILGMTRAEVRRKFDEIVAFSGVETYIDTPVKRYSSGMYVRLAFAVAAHLEPEILIVDEVLAVGDAEFQRKCLGKMQDVAGQGRTVLFVSHNLASIQNLCRTAIWLDNGTIASGKSEVSAVVASYEQAGSCDRGQVDISPSDHRVVSPFQMHRIEILGLNGRTAPTLKYGEPIRIRLFFLCSETVRNVTIGVALRSRGLVFATLLTDPDDFEAATVSHVMECSLPGGTLLPGLFELDCGASRDPANIGLDYVRDAATLSISDSGIDQHWIRDRHNGGIVNLPACWQRYPSNAEHHDPGGL